MATAILFVGLLWVHFSMPNYALTFLETIAILAMLISTVSFDLNFLKILSGKGNK